jgi:hypothetical protein
MVKFSTVKPGDVLYDYHSTSAGNTTARRWANWEVKVVSVDHEAFTATVRWNGNAVETWSARRISRLRRKPGKVRDPFAAYRTMLLKGGGQ